MVKEEAAAAPAPTAEKVVKIKDGVAMKIPKEGQDMSVVPLIVSTEVTTSQRAELTV